MSDLTNPIFHDEDAARAHFEALRWPNGPVCPHCGAADEATLVKGKSHRPGMYQCNACRKPFTVKVGTVMEASHIPLRKWALGFHLMASSKKGMSAHQLHRMLGVTYKTAWFMSHRIREAMNIEPDGPMGGDGGVVEVDETWVGRKKGAAPVRGGHHRNAVVSLVERNGSARSIHVANVNGATIASVLEHHMSLKANLMTDESTIYRGLGWNFASHGKVNHSKKEYVREDIHTNTIEGFFSILKRGLTGVYQHVSEQHLQRYLNEFDFRYTNREKVGVNDTMRTELMIKGIEGKRLTYNQSTRRQAA